MSLTEIQLLALDDIWQQVRRSLSLGLDVELLADFVAGVDWSRYADASLELREALAELEDIVAKAESGEFDRPAAALALLRLLPPSEVVKAFHSLPEDPAFTLFGPFTEANQPGWIESPDQEVSPGDAPQNGPDAQYRVVSL